MKLAFSLFAAFVLSLVFARALPFDDADLALVDSWFSASPGRSSSNNDKIAAHTPSLSADGNVNSQQQLSSVGQARTRKERSDKGKPWSEERKAKAKAIRKERKDKGQVRGKRRDAKERSDKGVPWSEERKQRTNAMKSVQGRGKKISESRKGKVWTKARHEAYQQSKVDGRLALRIERMRNTRRGYMWIGSRGGRAERE